MGANQNAQKLLSADLVNTKYIYVLYMYMYMYMLWFKFSFGAKFLKLAQ